LDEWTCDTMTVLYGEAILFDFPFVEDAIFKSLIASSEYDATAQKILQMLFSALSLLVTACMVYITFSRGSFIRNLRPI